MDDLGTRVSSAELEIDGINSTILLKADKIDLQGYVTASQLAAELAEFELTLSDSITVRTLNVTGATSTDSLNATSLSTTNIRVQGTALGLKSATFLTSATTIEVVATGGVVTNVNFHKKTGSVNYLGW